VDVYWVHDGGEDPAEFIRRWGERVATVHLKDRKDGTFCEVGQGELDFPAIFAAIEPLGLEWVVAEQDRTERDPAESIEMSRTYLREVIGV
jgi:sugar phosphate isomerase/epimerase